MLAIVCKLLAVSNTLCYNIGGGNSYAKHRCRLCKNRSSVEKRC